MENYEETRFKLTNTQLNKLKSSAKNKTRTTLIITKKNFQDERQPHELFLTTCKPIKDKSITRNIFRIQSDDSIVSGFILSLL